MCVWCMEIYISGAWSERRPQKRSTTSSFFHQAPHHGVFPLFPRQIDPSGLEILTSSLQLLVTSCCYLFGCWRSHALKHDSMAVLSILSNHHVDCVIAGVTHQQDAAEADDTIIIMRSKDEYTLSQRTFPSSGWHIGLVFCRLHRFLVRNHHTEALVAKGSASRANGKAAYRKIVTPRSRENASLWSCESVNTLLLPDAKPPKREVCMFLSILNPKGGKPPSLVALNRGTTSCAYGDWVRRKDPALSGGGCGVGGGGGGQGSSSGGRAGGLGTEPIVDPLLRPDAGWWPNSCGSSGPHAPRRRPSDPQTAISA